MMASTKLCCALAQWWAGAIRHIEWTYGLGSLLASVCGAAVLCFVTDLTLQQSPPRMREMNQGQGVLLVRPMINPHTCLFWTWRTLARAVPYCFCQTDHARLEMKGGRE